MTAVDWSKVQVRAGDYTCPEHGVIKPWQQLVPACRDCGRAAHLAVYSRGQVVTVEPMPPYCAGPERHPLKPGRVYLGTAACLCSPSGIHRSWTCAECGDVQQYPDHSVGDSAPFYGPGSQ